MCVLAGWLLGQAALEREPPVPSEAEILERSPSGARGSPGIDPDRMSPRELRSLPALGPGRAVDIARARWELGLTGGPEAWEELPGIGPETVRAIRRAVDERKSIRRRPGPWCGPAARP